MGKLLSKKRWHIDHIKPCSSFDFSIKEEQYKCFHYTNLQPMWGLENMSKNDKWEPSLSDSPDAKFP